MSFTDIFRKSFLEGYFQVDTKSIIICLVSATIIGLYIFFAYRVMTRNTIYDKSINISLPILAIITSAIILSIQSNIIISLGMVGALSIVRFRTAIKSAMDLIFLFWAISIGIICGAGLTLLAIALSLTVTIALFVLDRYPTASASMLLVINSADIDSEEKIVEVAEKHNKSINIKSRNMSATQLDMVIECRPKNAPAMVRDMVNLDGMKHVSLISHDGEITY